MKSKRSTRSFCAFTCAAALTLSLFGFTTVEAQKRVVRANATNFGGPVLTATLTDSFDDPDGDGKAAPGTEVTYTTTVTNAGTTDATNVAMSIPVDVNTTLVPGSVKVQGPMDSYVIRCTFSPAGVSDGCSEPSANYGAADDETRFMILGGQNSYLKVTAANAIFNAGTGIFSFDASVQNLLPNALGSLDGRTLDTTGVRLFVQNLTVTSGSGDVSVVNADGTADITAPNQPYFQYNQILAENQVSNDKNVQLAVSAGVDSFTVDFLVQTRVQLKLIINEVLVNPGGTITDASGEWFEVYNAGIFPVQMQNLWINDYNLAGYVGGDMVDDNHKSRPPHTIASSLTVQPGGYVVLGNTTNTTNNGGVPVDYAYGAALALANSLDGVRIAAPPSFSPDNVSILSLDIAIYSNPATSAQNGVSRELKNPALPRTVSVYNVPYQDMDQSNWADASVVAVYGPGGRGTPKAQNSAYTPFWEPAKLGAPLSFDQGFGIVARSGAASQAAAAVPVSVGSIPAGTAAVVTYKVKIAGTIPNGTTQVGSQGSLTGGNFTDMVTDDPSTVAVDDATMTPLAVAPTAASVSVGGRVLAGGVNVANAVVYLTDQHGNTRSTRTNSFGRFGFEDVAAGQIYVVGVSAKRYSFAPQAISVDDELTELRFSALE